MSDLALYQRLAMGDKLFTSKRVGAARLAAFAAAADEAVADDPGSVAADPTASDSDSHGEDSAAMEHLAVNSANRAANDARWQRAVAEHERQRRLRSYQACK